MDGAGNKTIVTAHVRPITNAWGGFVPTDRGASVVHFWESHVKLFSGLTGCCVHSSRQVPPAQLIRLTELGSRVSSHIWLWLAVGQVLTLYLIVDLPISILDSAHFWSPLEIKRMNETNWVTGQACQTRCCIALSGLVTADWSNLVVRPVLCKH